MKEYRSTLDIALQELINNNKKYDLEFKIIRADDGQERDIYSQAELQFDDNNIPVRVIGVIRDITLKKSVFESLKHSEERYKKLFDKSTNPVFVVDTRNGQYLNANKKAEEMTGRSEEELKKLTVKDITSSGGKERLNIFNKISTDSIDLGEVEYVRPDGSIRNAIISGVPMEENKMFGLATDITELRLAEKEIIESEELYRAILNTSPDGIAILDIKDGRMDIVSSGMVKMLGYSNEEEFIGKSFSDYLIPEDKEFAFANFNLALKDKLSGSIEYRALRVDGSYFYCEANSKVLRNSEGEPKQLIVVIRDIDKRKHEESELRDSRAKFKDVLENSLSSSYKRNLITNTYDYLSPVFEKISGFKPEEIMLLSLDSLMELIHPEDIPEMNRVLTEAIKRKIQKGYQLYYRFRHKNNVDYRWLHDQFIIIFDEQGQATSLIGSVSDITESRKAEDDIRESEKRLSDLILSSNDFVWEVDEKGLYTFGSHTVKEMLGFTVAEIIGKTPFDFQEPDEAKRVGMLFSEIAANKLPVKDLENWNIHKDGSKVCLLTNGVPILDKECNLKGYRGMCKNITQRKKEEIELIKAKEKAEESDNLKSAFLSNMSHEIRTPMNAILGFSGFLKDPELSNENREKYCEIINISSKQLLTIIEDIVEISKLETKHIMLLSD